MRASVYHFAYWFPLEVWYEDAKLTNECMVEAQDKATFVSKLMFADWNVNFSLTQICRLWKFVHSISTMQYGKYRRFSKV